MATYKEWNDHFDRIDATKLKTYMKAFETLENDSMIKREYGMDISSLKTLIQASLAVRKRK